METSTGVEGGAGKGGRLTWSTRSLSSGVASAPRSSGALAASSSSLSVAAFLASSSSFFLLPVKKDGRKEEKDDTGALHSRPRRPAGSVSARPALPRGPPLLLPLPPASDGGVRRWLEEDEEAGAHGGESESETSARARGDDGIARSRLGSVAI